MEMDELPEHNNPLTPQQKPKRQRPVRKIVRRPPPEQILSGQTEDDIRFFAQRQRRAATVGDGTRPEVGISNDGRYIVGWNVSPSRDPHANIYGFESKKSLTQILESLKECFKQLELDITTKPPTTAGETIKLKGQSKKKLQVVKVQLTPTEKGSVVAFKRPGNFIQDEFYDLVKQIEQTLVV